MSSSVAGKRDGEVVEDGLRGLPRGAEVALHQVLQVDPELVDDRAVEPHLRVEHGELLFGREGAQHHHGRVAGDELHQQEAHQDDAEELRPDEEEAAADVAEDAHRSSLRRLLLAQRAGERAPARRVRQHLDARADQREAEHGDRERDAGEDRGPPLAGDDVLESPWRSCCPTRAWARPRRRRRSLKARRQAGSTSRCLTESWARIGAIEFGMMWRSMIIRSEAPET